MRLMLSATTVLIASALGAAAQTPSVADLFSDLKGSVVVIHTVRKELDTARPGFVDAEGLGSGVLIDAKGSILTAAHVVHTAEKVEVEFAGGERIPARIVTSQALADIALVRVEKMPANPVIAKLGNSGMARVGDPIFVIGAPLGISHSLSVGVVSGRREARSLFGGLSRAEMFQTDASINQGNSGGPMFNMAGEVIGIVSSILSRSGGSEGIGFAVTSNTASAIIAEGVPWAGLEGLFVSGNAAGLLNLPQTAALLVQRIATGSPADKMGLRPGTVRALIEGEEILLGGDVILAVNGIRFSEEGATEKVLASLRSASAGSRISLAVLRAGRQITVDYTVPSR